MLRVWHAEIEFHAYHRTHCIDSSEASTNIYSNVEQKDLIRILKESHEDRIRQITTFQQGRVMWVPNDRVP